MALYKADKASVLASKRTQHFSLRKIYRLNFHGETIPLCFDVCWMQKYTVLATSRVFFMLQQVTRGIWAISEKLAIFQHGNPWSKLYTIAGLSAYVKTMCWTGSPMKRKWMCWVVAGTPCVVSRNYFEGDILLCYTGGDYSRGCE